MAAHRGRVVAILLAATCGVREAKDPVFPSAGYSYIIPGGHVAPTASVALNELHSARGVLQWELQHADLTYGGAYAPSENRNLTAIGYMYTQALDFDPSTTEQALRRRALREGEDYENLFLHLAEDTTFFLPNPTHASTTSLAGIPWLVGYTATTGHAGFWLYQTPGTWDADVFSGYAVGGALYVYQFERFDGLSFNLSQGGGDGTFLVEYPSAVAPSTVAAAGVEVTRLATMWSTMALTQDTTNGLKQDGALRWDPPSDWEMASTHDGSGKTYGGTGPYMGQVALQNGGVGFVLRITWVPTTESGVLPRLRNVLLRRWITEVTESDPSVQVVPGWDAANDVDLDGWISDAEFATRAAPWASARFRHEARAVPLGRMWSAQSSWCRVNPWAVITGLWLGDYLKGHWAERGYGGAYNDDLLKLVGPSEYNILNGGQLQEQAYAVNSSEIKALYFSEFAKMLSVIANITKGLLTGNISGRNLFMDVLTRPFLDNLKGFLREDYLQSGIGLTGYFGLQKVRGGLRGHA
jgi:hypothetical protein